MEDKAKRTLLEYARDALTILDQSLTLYRQGKRSFYRVAAVQLRILLCDTTTRHGNIEGIALLPLLLPDARFLPLDPSGHPLENGGSLLLDKWLDQPVDAKNTFTVRQLIRRVCDTDGGAHVDPKPNAGLPGEINSERWIIAVAEYINCELSSILRG